MALLREGYGFISSRCRIYGTDLFEARLMLRRVVCMSGAEAARVFYGAPGRFTRKGALPALSFALIQDQGSVMALDGAAHRERKAMFLSFMRPERLGGLVDDLRRRALGRVERWPSLDRFRLFDEANLILTGAVCDWAGLRLAEAELERRAAEFAAMIDGTGSTGPRNWRGHLLRRRTERWARGVIGAARAGTLPAPEGGAVRTIADWRDSAGERLDLVTAGVELINVLRPTVANARYVVFAAMALEARPELREEIARDDGALDRFVQEVRRFYPFIPFMAGLVREPFEWRGRRFAENEWVLLDIYGTNRDPRVWRDPVAFRPERFASGEHDPFAFVPSGGGPHECGHRCPGEWITIECVKTLARMLAGEVAYSTPPQDLELDPARIPALPPSGFVVEKARLTGASARTQEKSGMTRKTPDPDQIKKDAKGAFAPSQADSHADGAHSAEPAGDRDATREPDEHSKPGRPRTGEAPG